MTCVINSYIARSSQKNYFTYTHIKELTNDRMVIITEDYTGYDAGLIVLGL